jgi:AcrR family transcriptional regulator
MSEPQVSTAAAVPAKPKAGRERGDREDTTTVAKVIDAAVDCILEEGFYRASSNQIARRAGVTWGVIQYHFGTREGLLLAVFKRSADQLLQTLEQASITGVTTRERLESLADVIWSYYRRPEFLAYTQIILNLSHDPTTAKDTVATMAKLNENTMGLWQKLFNQALPTERQQPELARALFDVMRGLAIGQELTAAIGRPGTRTPPRAGDDPARITLIDALARTIDPS